LAHRVEGGNYGLDVEYCHLREDSGLMCARRFVLSGPLAAREAGRQIIMIPSYCREAVNPGTISTQSAKRTAAGSRAALRGRWALRSGTRAGRTGAMPVAQSAGLRPCPAGNARQER